MAIGIKRPGGPSTLALVNARVMGMMFG